MSKILQHLLRGEWEQKESQCCYLPIISMLFSGLRFENLWHFHVFQWRFHFATFDWFWRIPVHQFRRLIMIYGGFDDVELMTIRHRPLTTLSTLKSGKKMKTKTYDSTSKTHKSFLFVHKFSPRLPVKFIKFFRRMTIVNCA